MSLSLPLQRPTHSRSWLSRTLLSIACALPLGASLGAAESSQEGAAGSSQIAVVPGEEALPVQRVVLYSTGIGYFEHAGTVTGNAEVELRFTSEQINDILKSLLIQDLDGGRVASVAYPSQEPLNRLLGSFAVNLDGHPSLVALLAQLRGAEVSVNMADSTITGTILGVENRPRAMGDTTLQQAVLNVVTASGIRSITVDQMREVQLTDPQLQRELTRALLALAEARSQDKKPITIRLTGDGARRVALGYVVEAPIWKTSYRLVLPHEDQGADEAPDSILQGWAIVENTTDHDWDGVELSLVSGRPIAFIENLYESIYIPRPLFQPERYASLGAQQHSGGFDLFGGEVADADHIDTEDRLQELAPASAPLVPDAVARRGVALAAADSGIQTQNRGRIDPTAGFQSVAEAGQTGELFQYTVSDVELTRRRSAMLPVITSPIQLERLSIYNPDTLAGHPLRGARVTNNTELHLLSGPVTVVDSGTYAGDARIDDLAPGADRLISYAIDLSMDVHRDHSGTQSVLVTGVIVDGVLRLQRREQRTTTYVVENHAEVERELLIEHAVLPGWTLVDTPDPIEDTETHHRFQLSSAAGSEQRFSITQQRTTWQSVQLLRTNANGLIAYAGNEQIPDSVRTALRRAIELHRQVETARRAVNSNDHSIRNITTEQQRIRANMASVDRNSSYYARMLGKLDQQETQIESLQRQRDAANQQLQAAERALREYLHSLDVN